MTVLRWKPSTENTMVIPLADYDAFSLMMEKAGFRLPCTLSDDELPILRGMAAAAENPSPFMEIINLIVAHDSIDLIPTS